MKNLCNGVAEPVIFDVGAHQGEISALFRDIFPSAVIHAFEPFPESFATVQRRFAADSRTHVHRHGLSERDSVRKFHSNQSSATNSLLPTDGESSKSWRVGQLETCQVIEAEFKTLDSVMEERNVERIDILKLDVQGAESLVMRGGENAFRHRRVGLIYTEIITQPTYVGQLRFDEALAVFYNMGFDLHGLYNLSLTSQGRLRQLDAIFTQRAD